MIQESRNDSAMMVVRPTFRLGSPLKMRPSSLEQAFDKHTLPEASYKKRDAATRQSHMRIAPAFGGGIGPMCV